MRCLLKVVFWVEYGSSYVARESEKKKDKLATCRGMALTLYRCIVGLSGLVDSVIQATNDVTRVRISQSSYVLPSIYERARRRV